MLTHSLFSRDEPRRQDWNLLRPYCYRKPWLEVLARLEASSGVVGVDGATIDRQWILRVKLGNHWEQPV